MSRHEFPGTVRSSLAHRAGFSCANPNCRASTAGPSEESELARSDVGVASHITAASPGGPRYDASLSQSDRTSIDNGVWLCQVCAKKIDDDFVTYPADLLRRWKSEVEADAANLLGRPSAMTIARARERDPLERMIAHRMRDALAAATFPIAMMLPRSVGKRCRVSAISIAEFAPQRCKGFRIRRVFRCVSDRRCFRNLQAA
jgi:hypothetical protein